MGDSDEFRSSAARWRWLTFSLRSLAIVVTIAAIILATFAQQIRERWFGPRLPYRIIHNIDDLHEALRAERSVVYCDMEWSLNAASGRITFREFASDWQKRMPSAPVRFYLLDLTEREDDTVMEAVRLGLNRSTGSGELLWIRDGTPREYTFGTEHHSHAELANIAQQTFELSSVAIFPGNPKGLEDSELWYWDDDVDYSSPSSSSESR